MIPASQCYLRRTHVLAPPRLPGLGDHTRVRDRAVEVEVGLVRHMAAVERNWFRRVMAGEDVPRLYRQPDDRDADFNGAVGDPAVVEDAFTSWKAEIAAADAWLDQLTDLDALVRTPRDDEDVSIRDVLIHMVEEYARHCGHADLLRECIDGRTGQ